MKSKICHIVNWYPNKFEKYEALWTRNHIESLQSKIGNDIFHVELRTGKIGKHFYKDSDNVEHYIITSNTKIWLIRELITTILLVYVCLFKIKRKKYLGYNFQISYPLLTYSKLIQFILKKQIVVTEHWSAYHNNFGVKKELKRIQKIFKNKKLKFIYISKALQKDVERFSKTNTDCVIIPNIVSSNYKYTKTKPQHGVTFLMSSYWKEPKQPEIIIQAFANILNKKPTHNINLKIGGYGPKYKNLNKMVNELELKNNVSFINKISSAQFNSELNNSNYFLHCSSYETFSVVCAEALSSGTPVIASNVGGIPEFCNATNSILVDNNSVIEWEKVIEQGIYSDNWNHQAIADEAHNKFNSEKVGNKYYETLMSFYGTASK